MKCIMYKEWKVHASHFELQAPIEKVGNLLTNF